jgi:hypothetical protein
MKIQLKKALKHKGQELTELDIPLENLTGSDLIDSEQQYFRSGKATPFPDLSKGYLVRIAARAAKIPIEVLETLSAQDFVAVAGQVQVFLMGLGSETGETESEVTTPETDPETSFEG